MEKHSNGSFETNNEKAAQLQLSTNTTIKELTEAISDEDFAILFKQQCRDNHNSEGLITKIVFNNLHFKPDFSPSLIIYSALEDLEEEGLEVYITEESEIIFSNCILKDGDLKRWSLEGVSFINTSLENADMREGEFQDAVFENCNLTYADLREAVLREAMFDNCNLHGALFNYAELAGTCIIMEPHLRSKNLNRTQFDHDIVKMLREMIEYGICVPWDYVAKDSPRSRRTAIDS